MQEKYNSSGVYRRDVTVQEFNRHDFMSCDIKRSIPKNNIMNAKRHDTKINIQKKKY